MKKILTIAIVFISSTVFAHPGHGISEFANLMAAVQHYFSSNYHIVAILSLSFALMTGAFFVYKRKQVLSLTLTLFGVLGSILGIGLLLS
ncbi:hypothetical protein MS2017_2028 [Bathymodiolus thermophilus thioautotrophic gill symbiont]|uniref:Uncharacterized protein n=1 Tax=Bathymodiolus thermophilus thioautotrophic gill symbiont TaxID=2360 RepID=A0A3G3IP81_9GAMM|nr:hypothetical protein [Bathymodiolus thermophilus thioautotrophic gill symbiont]AYQ57686.1 hypothetical protein MS2017_2028 [Bathymodiolus thermophilus thioautotrophic gill symbiont]